MKFIRFLPLMVLFAGMIACFEDTIQLDNISTDFAIQHELAMPLVKADFVFDDIAGHGYDSLIVQSGDTIFLYLVEDIGFNDTLKLGKMGEKMDFDFIYLHYKIANMFPVGLDLRIYLYDSIQAHNIDTIWFSNNPDQLFIEPAPVGPDGLVLEDEVQTYAGYIEIDSTKFDNLFHVATNLVVDAIVPSTGSYVKVLNYYRLNMRLGLHFKGRYVASSDSSN
jgi:hypothetical protein